MIASRLIQNTNEAAPSPSTHTLVVYESPLNTVDEQINTMVSTDALSTMNSSKHLVQTTTPINPTLNRTKTTSKPNTPALINTVVETQMDSNKDENEDDEKDLSEEIRLEFNEDDDEDEEVKHQENRVDNEQGKEIVDNSILTDDDDDSNKENNEEANVTGDVLNTTVEKSFSALPCTSFYKS